MKSHCSLNLGCLALKWPFALGKFQRFFLAADAWVFASSLKSAFINCRIILLCVIQRMFSKNTWWSFICQLCQALVPNFFVFIHVIIFKSFLNWMIICLRYCVSFYHTSTWNSHRFTMFPPSLNSFQPPTHPTPLVVTEHPVWAPYILITVFPLGVQLLNQILI